MIGSGIKAFYELDFHCAFHQTPKSFIMLRRLLKKQKPDKKAAVSYVIEVSLIILSILIAVQADRYNQSRKDQAKLNDYLQSTYQDLLDEQFFNKNNYQDCLNDMKDLKECLRLCRYDQNDSLQKAIYHLKVVLSRGVFRAFPPTTFDIMTSNGDISLIEDLSFRKRLAAVFSFREAYVQKDLQDFDIQTKEVAKSMGKYLDLECLTKSDILYPCLIDRKGFVEDVHNELVIYFRQADIRAFHLKTAIRNFDLAINQLEELYDLKQE